MACKENHGSVQIFMKELPLDQGREGRHKSPHAAYAKGYLEGVRTYYKN